MIEVMGGAQVLIRIKVEDALTGSPLSHADIHCSVSSEGNDYNPATFSVNSKGGGWYVMAMSYLQLAAKFRLGVSTTFRFHVSQFGYQDRESLLIIPQADFSVVTEEVTMGEALLKQQRIVGAPFDVGIMLEPSPVRLAGQVIRDDDPAEPVIGAEVRLNDSATSAQTTDDAGRFLFDELPLAQIVRVSADDGESTITQMHLINYNKPTNHITLSIRSQTTD